MAFAPWIGVGIVLLAVPVPMLGECLAGIAPHLRPGQVVSLGSFSALLPPKAGQKVTAHYDGVTGLQPVTVSFR